MSLRKLLRLAIPLLTMLPIAFFAFVAVYSLYAINTTKKDMPDVSIERIGNNAFRCRCQRSLADVTAGSAPPANPHAEVVLVFGTLENEQHAVHFSEIATTQLATRFKTGAEYYEQIIRAAILTQLDWASVGEDLPVASASICSATVESLEVSPEATDEQSNVLLTSASLLATGSYLDYLEGHIDLDRNESLDGG